LCKSQSIYVCELDAWVYACVVGVGVGVCVCVSVSVYHSLCVRLVNLVAWDSTCEMCGVVLCRGCRAVELLDGLLLFSSFNSTLKVARLASLALSL